MEEDQSELNPGRSDFWRSFYEEEDGRLARKQVQFRRSDELNHDGSSLLDHYEWFMGSDLYESAVVGALQAAFQPKSAPVQCTPLRVLHLGCGNSDLCDHLPAMIGAALPKGASSSSDVETLNVDICENIIGHLIPAFPHRRYAVADCCALVSPRKQEWAKDEWYALSDDGPPSLVGVQPGSVDLVVDKGTADALLSAFAGEFNPNVDKMFSQALEVLRPGGAFVIISINSEDVLCPYIYSATHGKKGFAQRFKQVIVLDEDETRQVRVETLGSRYHCYGFTVVED